MNFKMIRTQIAGPTGGAAARRSKPPIRPAPFSCVDAMIEAARQVFRAREDVAMAEQCDAPDAAERSRRARDEEARWTRSFHASFDQTGDAIPLAAAMRRSGFNRTEHEILLILVLDRLALLRREARTPGEILNILGVAGTAAVRVMRSLSETGRLARSGLVAYEDEDEDLRERRLVIDPNLIDLVLRKKACRERGLPVATEKELYGELQHFTRLLRRKADQVNDFIDGFPCGAQFFRVFKKADRMHSLLMLTLERHPDWKLNRLLRAQGAQLGVEERAVLLALLGKELGHLKADDALFQGAGLARAACGSCDHIDAAMGFLRSNGALVREGYVSACGGPEPMVTDDSKVLEATEFELGGKSLELLEMDRTIARKRGDDIRLQSPRVGLEQLVLSRRVTHAIRLAAAHVRHSGVLMDGWGLAEAVPYGRAVTLLFTGPPGVGKTACAEALAREIGKPLLVADYSRIQNCLVGNTEKNIVRTFHEARKSDAVLFWDEADAMFFDRDSAHHAWEVRAINVLLTEIERFEGVCVLATNRKVCLDRALERRITLKVDFEVPDRSMRRRIWERLIPARMPLSQCIDLEKLAEKELTGGQIKNVILNAARMAVARNGKGPVMMHDFLRGVEMERKGSFSEPTFSGTSIGF